MIITKTANRAAAMRTTFYLAQRAPHLPIGDAFALAAAAKAEGATVSQLDRHGFVVNGFAFVNYAGAVCPI